MKYEQTYLENATAEDIHEKAFKCIVDGAHGVYIPRRFAKEHTPALWSIPNEWEQVLKAGPGGEDYWDVWESTLNNAEMVEENGKQWILHAGPNGDLFAVNITLISAWEGATEEDRDFWEGIE